MRNIHVSPFNYTKEIIRIIEESLGRTVKMIYNLFAALYDRRFRLAETIRF